jgi:hypothetical protein
MGALSPVLRDTENNGLVFWCPGCNESHRIQHGAGPGPRWGWNGSASKPTFTPSVLVTSGHYVSFHKPGDPCWCSYSAEHPEEKDVPQCCRCHSFVTDGRIQFLSDCTHHLVGQTVDLPPWPEARAA